MSHTMQHVNDSHRMRYVYGKCIECLIIQEHAYCIDDQEFFYPCSCGAAANTMQRVRVETI